MTEWTYHRGRDRHQLLPPVGPTPHYPLSFAAELKEAAKEHVGPIGSWATIFNAVARK